MSSRKNIWLIIIVVGLTLSVFTSNVLGENFVKYYIDNDGGVSFYDKDSVKRTSGIVKVWVRDIWENKMKILEKRGVSIEGYEKLSYTMTLIQVNYNDETYHILSYTEYDSDGNGLYISHRQNDWSHIVSGSIKDKLKESVCK